MVKLVKYSDGVEEQYQILWDTMVIKDDWKSGAYRTAKSIIANKDKYERIEKETNVPWYFIGIIHNLEGGMNFRTHLHNGDSLERRTVNVPRGRPLGDAPFTFEESAKDALTMPGKEYHKIADWSIPHMAFLLEKYNGFGYRTRGCLSPYLWSGSNHYIKGKYVSDGKFDASAVSKQTGAMVLLKAILDVDKELKAKEPETNYAKVVDRSRRIKLVEGANGFLRYLTVPFTMSLAFLKDVKEFAQDNAGLIIIGTLASGWLVTEFIRYLSKQEVEEGRYKTRDQM